MLGFIRRRGFLVLLGFLLLAAFIWYAGPYFAFNEYYPLESVNARLVLFGAILALWIASRLLRRLRSYRASDQLAAAVVQQAAAEPARPSAEAVQLGERFEEAVKVLKGSRRTGHSLYDLPWYVIIGAPGSGKTTALLNSGLKFPLEQRVGKGALRGVGGTRNCDWWFTDEAVFLDTAGRYTTQDSDATSDSAAWGEFLSLLVKYRKRRPVNGVILTISAQDLIVQGDAGRDAHVEAARRRLNELNETLRIQLPVYVLVTKCDLVAGFTEYFEDLTQEGRTQVWGVTFPYDQTLNGDAAAAFPAEFDQLMARLNARVFGRVEEDRDARRRTRIFAFPQQIAAIRDSLARFVGDVFASTRLDRQILLRGVYLTSGTQEGTPIDRLLGAISRRYGVASDALPPPTGRGKAYFVERLLKDVLIAESGLAGVNRRLEMQKAAMQLGAYAAMALVAVGGVILLSISYNRNGAYLAQTAHEITKLSQAPLAGPTDRVEALLPRLNAIRAIVDVADQYRSDPPWSMRWGLYQGNPVGSAARDAYVRELDGTLLPRVAARIEERLGQYGSEPEKLFEYLKAYLMLGDSRRLDKSHLQFISEIEWQAADAAVPQAGATLAKHFQSLLEYSDSLRPIGLNERIVIQARSTIRQASLPLIVYGRLKRMYQNDATRVVRLDQLAGVGVEQVLRRKSGKSLTTPVSSLYARPVFKEMVASTIPSLVDQFAKDDWAWGEDKGRLTASYALGREVIDLYERDYIAVWDEVLQDIELVPFTTLAQTVDALGILAAQTSPLKGLLTAVADNTKLIEPTGAAATAVDSMTKTIRERVGKLFDQVPKQLKPRTDLPGVLVTANFQPIHRVLAGEPGQTPLDQVLSRIGQVQHHLRSLALDPSSTPPDALSDPMLREILASLRDDTATLPPVVQSLVAQVGRKAEVSVGSSASSELMRRYETQVVKQCQAVLANRYPFTVTGREELPLEDFVRLFAFDGLFDRFFTENLEGLVDASETSWTWRPGEVTGSRDMLQKFEAAHRIRDLFFRRGVSRPVVPYTLNISKVDPNIPGFRMEIDGLIIDARDPKQIRPLVWPGPVLGRAAVRFDTRVGAATQENFDGAWGLFKMFDLHAQRISDAQFVLGFEMDGQEARVLVDADRVNNPFGNREWQRFRCGS